MQNDETKTLENDSNGSEEGNGRMQYTANKNVERSNLYGSDHNFNELRT